MRDTKEILNPSSSSQPASRGVALPLLVAALVIVAYAASFRGTFLFDDTVQVTNNESIRSFPACILRSSRPVTEFTFFLNYATGKLRVGGFHAVNLVVHLAAALLLYGTIRRTIFGAARLVTFVQSASLVAAVTAAWWALHPLQTGSVTYIAQRAESLMGMFCLLTLYCVARSMASPHPSRWHVAAIVSCALGMASKATMVVVPLLVLLYDRTFFAESFANAWRRRRGLHTGLWATLLVGVFLLTASNESSTSVGFQEGVATPFAYLGTQFGVVARYLSLSVWPVGQCLDYAWPIARTAPTILVPAIPVLLLLGFSIAGTCRRTTLGFLGIWFFLTLAPTSSIIPVADAAFEHRMYLPLAGLVAAAVFGMRMLARTRTFAIAGIMLAGVLALGTHMRNLDYESEMRMWADVVAKRPANLRAWIDLGIALAEEGHVQDAVGIFGHVRASIPADVRREIESGEKTRAVPVQSNAYAKHLFRAHANLGVLLHRELKRPDLAIPHYRTALRIIPWNEGIRGYLDIALRETGAAK